MTSSHTTTHRRCRSVGCLNQAQVRLQIGDGLKGEGVHFFSDPYCPECAAAEAAHAWAWDITAKVVALETKEA